MNTLPKSSGMMFLAFLTATASSVYIAENLLLRALPLPFIRLGLSNVLVLYLLMQKRPLEALLVNILKSLIGAVFTFTLLSPATLLSLGGGLASLLAMYLFCSAIPGKLGFSIIGISIVGAITHNIVQIFIVRLLIIKSDSVFSLLPLMLLLGLISGIIIAWISSIFSTFIQKNDFIQEISHERA